MSVGDLVKVKNEGLSLNVAQMCLGHTGIIFEIREKRNETFVFINSKLVSFLPHHLEVISESR
jgi:hypothetical protein